jgi:C1A family cysteine protease
VTNINFLINNLDVLKFSKKKYLKMKFYFLATLILTSLLLALCQSDIDIDDDQEWEEFKRVHEKSYTDEQRRREIWSQNRQRIAKLNAKRRLFTDLEPGEQSSDTGFTLKMNKYGDLTHEEFSVLLNGFKIPKEYEKDTDRKTVNRERDLVAEYFDNIETAVPTSIDWRNNGFVTAVRDQGMCGCCYIFAATAALEGQYAKNYGKLLSLSDQNFLNCVKSGYFVDKNGVVEPKKPGIVQAFGFSVNGCNGGNADAVFIYNKYNGFLPLSSAPYRTTVSFNNLI